MQLEELVVPLKLNNESFTRGIEGSITKASAFGTVLGNIATGAISGAFNLLGNAIEKVGGLLEESVGHATDLNESVNAVNVVFEDGAKIIEEYGKTSATTVGLSTAKFNQLASVTGAFLTNLGFDSEKAADKTIELTERASDMASVFNTDVSQALEAIQSGLKGEFNPLERFGVKLNAATIEAKAFTMGLADVNGEISDSAKAQAALALIMEQTNKLAGDFANTSDGLANGQRILAARFEDTKAKIATALLPVLETLQARFIELLDSPEFQKTIEFVTTKLTELGNWIITNLPIWEEKFNNFTTEVKKFYDEKFIPAVRDAKNELILFGIKIKAIQDLESKGLEISTNHAKSWSDLAAIFAVDVAGSLKELNTLFTNLKTILGLVGINTDGLNGKTLLLGGLYQFLLLKAAPILNFFQNLRNALQFVNARLQDAINHWSQLIQLALFFASAVPNTAPLVPAFSGGSNRNNRSGRASGGPVIAGQSYNVAEFFRPEVFTPNTSGRVDPARPITVEFDEDRLAKVMGRVVGEELQKALA